MGLVDHFKFEESSDFARYGAFGSTLHEPAGANVGNAAGKIGNAVDLSGNASTGWLWSSTFVPNLSANWSASFWFRADTLPGVGLHSVFLCRTTVGNLGTGVTLYNDAGTTKVTLYTWHKDATAITYTHHATAISTGTWYFVAVGVGDPDDTPGAMQQWISVNGGAKQTNTLNYLPARGLSHLRVGQQPAGKAGAGGENYDGRLDELSFFARNIGPSDIALLCNDPGTGCAGRTYPFETE